MKAGKLASSVRGLICQTRTLAVDEENQKEFKLFETRSNELEVEPTKNQGAQREKTDRVKTSQITLPALPVGVGEMRKHERSN